MLKKVYVFWTTLFATLAILGIYMGYLDTIFPVTAVAAIVLSGISAFYVSRRLRGDTQSHIGIIVILLLLAGVYLYTISSDMVFPHGAGDFQNHARFIRNMAKGHALYMPASEPQAYYGISALIYTLYPHTYVVNSILPIMFVILSALGVHHISSKFASLRTATIASFIYAFSLTNIWMLEQGFLPQIAGQFFFIAGIYYFLEKNIYGAALSSAGLISYPHYFLIYVIFFSILFLADKSWKKFIPPILGLLFMLPEIYVQLLGRSNLITQSSIPFRHILLINGGVITPTFLSLIIFIPALCGLSCMWATRQKYRVLLALTVSVITIILAVVLAFAYVSLSGYTKDIRYLYLVGKLFYLLVLPLSILSAIGLERVRKPTIIAALLAFQFVYFAGYVIAVLPEKANLPSGFYEIAEKMDTLPPEFTVGVDEDLIMNRDWKPTLLYKSLIDVPDTSYSTGGIAKVEIGRALHFWWAKNKTSINGALTPLNSKGEPILVYNQSADYYITNKKLNYPIVFENRGIYVYRMRQL